MIRRPRPTLTILLMLPTLLLLTACQPMIVERGNIISPEALERIRPGMTTRNEVLDLLGTPTFVNSFRKNRWVYLQDRRFEEYQAINRLVITFNSRWIVEDVERNFDQALWDPQALADERASERPNFFRRVWENEAYNLTPNAETDRRIELRMGPGPGESSEDQEEPWWKRILTGRIFTDRLFTNDELADQPAPESRFTSEEAGWWRSLWGDDPTRTAPGEPASEPDGAGNAADHPFMQVLDPG